MAPLDLRFFFFFFLLWKSMGVVNCLVTNILQQYLILCSVEETHTNLEKPDKPK